MGVCMWNCEFYIMYSKSALEVVHLLNREQMNIVIRQDT